MHQDILFVDGMDSGACRSGGAGFGLALLPYRSALVIAFSCYYSIFFQIIL